MAEVTREEREAAARAWVGLNDASYEAQSRADLLAAEERTARNTLHDYCIVTNDRVLDVRESGVRLVAAGDEIVDLRTPAPSDAGARLARLVEACIKFFAALYGSTWRAPNVVGGPAGIALRSALFAAESPEPVAHLAEARVKELEAALDLERKASTVARHNEQHAKAQLVAAMDRIDGLEAAIGTALDHLCEAPAYEARIIKRVRESLQCVAKPRATRPAPEPSPWIDGPPNREGGAT